MNTLFPPGSAFPPTHWTLIAAASGPTRETAVAELYRIYWRPLQAQARRLGVSESDLEDTIQEFLLKLFQDGSLQRAEPGAGRFRSYLAGALRHFVWRQIARNRAQKRGGGAEPLPIEAAEQIPGESSGPADEREFDLAWATALLQHALQRFTSELRAGFDAATASQLLPCALGEDDSSLTEIADRLEITVAAVKSRLFRMRQRFRAIVREEVLRTVPDESDCESELRYLCSVLEQTEMSEAQALAAA